MKSYTRLNNLLNSDNIAVLPNIYSEEIISKINLAVSPILAAQNNHRKYVSAIELLELGLINDIFSPTLLSMLFDLIDDPELYHCHIYEIAANQSTSHIKANNQLDGWHRDTDCKHDFNKPNLQHISFFIYLSDVEENSGCFEVSNKRLTLLPKLNNRETCFKLIGNKGTSFFFDRKSFHRASPNQSDTPRRVLKISIQSRQLFNHKQQEKIFQLVRESLPTEATILRQLFGASIASEHVHLTSTNNADILNIDNSIALPAHHFSPNFSFKQNVKRWYRDVRFILRRLAVKHIGLHDKKIPAPKIPYKKVKE